MFFWLLAQGELAKLVQVKALPEVDKLSWTDLAANRDNTKPRLFPTQPRTKSGTTALRPTGAVASPCSMGAAGAGAGCASSDCAGNSATGTTGAAGAGAAGAAATEAGAGAVAGAAGAAAGDAAGAGAEPAVGAVTWRGAGAG